MKHFILYLQLLAGLVLSPVIPAQVITPLSYDTPGKIYSQDFNSLITTGSFNLAGKGPFDLSAPPINNHQLGGWMVLMLRGSAANTQFTTGTGTGMGSGIYSFGATANTERALGFLASGSGVYGFGLLLVNQTGFTLDSCTISYTTEQWRKGGSNNNNVCTFRYRTGVNTVTADTLSFLTHSLLNINTVVTTAGASALNGNLLPNQVSVLQTIKNLQWKNGEQLLLRWDDNDEPGNDDALAMDEFSFVASGIVPPVNTIDTTAPEIISLVIPNHSMKGGDTIPVTITVKPDADVYTLANGFINGGRLSHFKKTNDSVYTTSVVITDSMSDVIASKDIPVMLILKDAAGNTSHPYTTGISQVSDPIDASRPFISMLTPPAGKLYKVYDTLFFVVDFSEPILIDSIKGIPALSITIGSRLRTVPYSGSNGSTRLLFYYIIQPGESDNDGIKLAVLLRLNGSILTDVVGNAAILNLPPPGPSHLIRIDAVAPAATHVGVPAPAIYPLGSTLNFTVGFKEPILVDTINGIPALIARIGSLNRFVHYTGGSGEKVLHFAYTVTHQDLDKKGIGLDVLLSFNGAVLTDSAGNEVVAVLKNIGSLSKVRVDGVAPFFVKDTAAYLSACAGISPVVLAEILTAKSFEPGETISWQIDALPRHGKLSGFPFSKITDTPLLTSPGFIYAPDSGFTGKDQFIISVRDEVNISSILVVITVEKAIAGNIVNASQVICKGSTANTLKGFTSAGDSSNYSYLWESSIVSDSTGYVRAAGFNTQPDYSPGIVTATTWYRRRIDAGACYNFSAPVQVAVAGSGIWLGNNNRWHQANNWCGSQLPTPTMDVFIPATALHRPVITETAYCNSLVIDSGAGLLITGSLQLKGDLTARPESVDALRARIEFNGISPQIIPAKLFHQSTVRDLVINNNSRVDLSAELKVTGIFSISNGSFFTNDLLHLERTARIGPAASGTRIIGNITVKHALPRSSAFYLLAHPFSTNTGLYAITDSIDITGEGGVTNGFALTNTNDPTAFYYDTAAGPLSFDKHAAWIPFTNTNGLDKNAWKRYQAIRLFPAGLRAQEAKPTIRMSGPVNQGEQEIHFPTGPYTGYQLAANPYPCPINMSGIAKSEGIGNYYWVWNNRQGINGGYTSIPFSSSLIMPAFSSFFIKTNALTENILSFPENCKFIGDLSEPAADSIEDIAHLELRLETDSIFWDRLLLFHIDSAREKYDRLDAEKILNNNVSFFSYSADSSRLSVDARSIGKQTVIPVGIESNQHGVFRIRVSKKQLPQQLELFLHDKVLNQWMLLQADSSYYFSIEAHNSHLSNRRFEISSFKRETSVINPPAPIQFTIAPIPATDQLLLYFSAPEEGNTSLQFFTLNGAIVKRLEFGFLKKGAYTIPIAALPKGIYIAELKCGKYTVAKKIIKG